MAFDAIDHDRLSTKSEHYVERVVALDWFRANLSNPYHIVKFGEAFSC